ncbi:MAG: hypothetical protein ACOCQD_02245 [archaeon]
MSDEVKNVIRKQINNTFTIHSDKKSSSNYIEVANLDWNSLCFLSDQIINVLNHIDKDIKNEFNHDEVILGIQYDEKSKRKIARPENETKIPYIKSCEMSIPMDFQINNVKNPNVLLLQFDNFIEGNHSSKYKAFCLIPFSHVHKKIFFILKENQINNTEIVKYITNLYIVGGEKKIPSMEIPNIPLRYEDDKLEEIDLIELMNASSKFRNYVKNDKDYEITISQILDYLFSHLKNSYDIKYIEKLTRLMHQFTFHHEDKK